MKSVFHRIRKNAFSESDETIQSFVSDVLAHGLSDGDTAELATALAQSGSRLDLGRPVTDIPSTGGPASLSTLAVPLLVALTGVQILKVSVPGKPAGALDTLETIPNYRSELSEKEIHELADRTRYVHVRAGEHLAPADAKLFRTRQQLKAVICPELVIASLLSKKLCISCDAFLLDVRVGTNGNVASDADEALLFAKRFIAVAKLLGIRVRCVVSDMRKRLQAPYVGRSESLRGLAALLTGTLTGDSADLLLRMAEEAVWVRQNVSTPAGVRDQIGSESMRRLAEMLEQHGVEHGRLESRLDEIERFTEIPIVASAGGTIAGFDLRRLKAVVMSMYARIPRTDAVPIWEVGLFWSAPEQVEKGGELCKVRVHPIFRDQITPSVAYITEELNRCIHLVNSNQAGDGRRLIIGIVDEYLQIHS